MPDTAAGKRIRCPKCKGAIDVPSRGETWTLKVEDGADYGPVSRQDLDAWHQEGRITAECQLLQTGAPQWQWASEVYPDLVATSTTPAASGGFLIDTGESRPGSSVITRGAKSSVSKRTKGGVAGALGKRAPGSPAITYLAYASYMICGLFVFAGVVIIVLGSTIAAIISGIENGADGAAAAQAAGGIVALIVFVIGMVFVLGSLPALLAGYGLMHRKKWGRILTLVLAAVNLPFLPLGTAYGVWAFIVLLDKKYADEFR